MNNLERNALKMWALTADLLNEAARAGSNGAGYTVVAFEARQLAEKLFDADAKTVSAITDNLKGLALNGMLEVIRVERKAPEMSKAITVCLDSILKLANEISSAEYAPLVLPEAANPIRSVDSFNYILPFCVGGMPFAETVDRVCEYLLIPQELISNNSVTIRGAVYPIIELGKARYGSLIPMLMIQASELILTPIDNTDLSISLITKIGLAAEPLPEYKSISRECWDAVGGGQIAFPDWDRFTKNR